jgi:hypothetical protein
MPSPKWWGETERRRQQNIRKALSESRKRRAEIDKAGGIKFDFDAALKRLAVMLDDDNDDTE